MTAHPDAAPSSLDSIIVVDSDDYKVWFKGRPLLETNAAFQFAMPNNKTVWIPKSQLKDDNEKHVIPRWLAEKKGLQGIKPRRPYVARGFRFESKFDDM